MKRICFLLIFLLPTIAVFAQDTVADYREKFMIDLLLANTKQDGLFSYTLTPMPIELAIVNFYKQWVEKRFNHDRMLKEIAELKNEYSKLYPAYLSLSYTGSWDSKGNTNLDIPKDLAEYIFIENDAGEYLACTEADIPIMGSVGTFNDSETITLMFPSPTALIEGSKAMNFEVGGLGFKDTKFTFPLPTREWFVDAPDELKRLYIDSGIWQE